MQTHTLTLPYEGVLDCQFHPTQPWIFTAGADSTLRLYSSWTLQHFGRKNHCCIVSISLSINLLFSFEKHTIDINNRRDKIMQYDQLSIVITWIGAWVTTTMYDWWSKLLTDVKDAWIVCRTTIFSSKTHSLISWYPFRLCKYSVVCDDQYLYRHHWFLQFETDAVESVSV